MTLAALYFDAVERPERWEGWRVEIYAKPHPFTIIGFEPTGFVDRCELRTVKFWPTSTGTVPSVGTVGHEGIHADDCEDDGILNGSVCWPERIGLPHIEMPYAYSIPEVCARLWRWYQ